MKKKVFCYLTKKKELKKKNFIKVLNFYNSCAPKRINFYILDFSKLLKDKTKLKINKNYAHFNLEESLFIHKHLKPQKTILTNLHSDLDYDYLRSRLPKSVIPAYDGLKLII